MKRNIIYPVLLATSVGIFAGCATQKNVMLLLKMTPAV